ncbi:DNA repair protein Rad60-like [Haematobia irritans]|uniref:DNA repair protein Rad60-like n=1 Tax=Haematobia irritans TaxID=7368 RepID=UPI003F508539
MNEEFDIFKNLDDFRKLNQQEILKSLERSNNSNGVDDVPNIDDSFNDDFDSFIGKRPHKRPKQINAIKDVVPVPDKVTEEQAAAVAANTMAKATSPLGNVSNEEPQVEQDIPITSSASIMERFLDQARGRRCGQSRQSHVAEIAARAPQVGFIDLVSSPLPHIEVELDIPTTSSASIMERFLDQARGRRCGQSRRSHVAEIAAWAPQVDFIDLVSSPLPRIEGTIVIGSDGEDEEPHTPRKSKRDQNITKSPCFHISLDDDNPELSIKVNWKGIPEAFKLRKYQKFSLIFQQLAEREGTNLSNIAFNINSRIITPDDTPDSIDYKIYQFINGRVITALNLPMGAVAPKKQRDQNKITVKIQSNKWKRPLQIDLQKTDKFRMLYIKCSEELSVDIVRLKLSFDGDLLELNDTPADLDFEGGEVIDLRFRY